MFLTSLKVSPVCRFSHSCSVKICRILGLTPSGPAVSLPESYVEGREEFLCLLVGGWSLGCVKTHDWDKSVCPAAFQCGVYMFSLCLCLLGSMFVFLVSVLVLWWTGSVPSVKPTYLPIIAGLGSSWLLQKVSYFPASHQLKLGSHRCTAIRPGFLFIFSCLISFKVMPHGSWHGII